MGGGDLGEKGRVRMRPRPQNFFFLPLVDVANLMERSHLALFSALPLADLGGVERRPVGRNKTHQSCGGGSGAEYTTDRTIRENLDVGVGVVLLGSDRTFHLDDMRL